MKIKQCGLGVALTGIFWLATVPAQANTIVDVNISNLTFQPYANNNACSPGPCTEVYNIDFQWDTTTNNYVPGTGIVNASGALPASDLPAPNNWTFGNNALYPGGPGLWITSVYTAPQDYVVIFSPTFVYPLLPGSYSYSGSTMPCYAAPTVCDSLFNYYAPSGGVYSAVAVAGTINISSVPEPSSLLLLGTGLLGLGPLIRRRIRSM